MKKTVYNAVTNTTTEEDLTAEELAQQEIDQVEYEAAKAIRLAEAEAKATQRQAILDRLGLTSEEANLLLS